MTLKLWPSASAQGSGGSKGAESNPGGRGSEPVEKYGNRPKLSPKSRECSPMDTKDCSRSCGQEVVGKYDGTKLFKPCPSVGANGVEPVKEEGRVAGMPPTFKSRSSRGGKFNQESSKCVEECGWDVRSFLKPELCSPAGPELRSESWTVEPVDKCGGMATLSTPSSQGGRWSTSCYRVSDEKKLAGGDAPDPRLRYYLCRRNSRNQGRSELVAASERAEEPYLAQGKISAGGGLRGPPVVAKRG